MCGETLGSTTSCDSVRCIGFHHKRNIYVLSWSSQMHKIEHLSLWKTEQKIQLIYWITFSHFLGQFGQLFLRFKAQVLFSLLYYASIFACIGVHELGLLIMLGVRMNQKSRFRDGTHYLVLKSYLEFFKIIHKGSSFSANWYSSHVVFSFRFGSLKFNFLSCFSFISDQVSPFQFIQIHFSSIQFRLL